MNQLVDIIQYSYIGVNRESAKYIIIFILTKIGMYDTLVLYLGRTKDST